MDDARQAAIAATARSAAARCRPGVRAGPGSKLPPATPFHHGWVSASIESPRFAVHPRDAQSVAGPGHRPPQAAPSAASDPFAGLVAVGRRIAASRRARVSSDGKVVPHDAVAAVMTHCPTSGAPRNPAGLAGCARTSITRRLSCLRGWTGRPSIPSSAAAADDRGWRTLSMASPRMRARFLRRRPRR